MSIGATISQLQATIEKTRQNAPLSAPKTVILGASKTKSAALIEQAIEAGLTDFGENKVQEAAEKWPDIKKRHPNIRLHLIGPLQSNKTKDALDVFDVIQTLDRPKLAEEIARHIGSVPNLKLFIQINTGKEPQKAGVMPEEADAFIVDCMTRLQLPIVGLMCIPPAGQPPAAHFAFLREMALRHNLPELSMGMSDDFETAVRMGSTMVRIGSALFGARE